MADTPDGGTPTWQTPMQEGLVAVHELYTNLREAGFTMHEAMAYIIELGKANHQ